MESQSVHAELPEHQPLTTERQLAKQLAASHRATMLLHGELERFLTAAQGADDIRRPNLLNWAEHMVAATVRMQAMHHDGVRTLMHARNEGKRLVDVTHHVDRPRGS